MQYLNVCAVQMCWEDLLWIPSSTSYYVVVDFLIVLQELNQQYVPGASTVLPCGNALAYAQVCVVIDFTVHIYGPQSIIGHKRITIHSCADDSALEWFHKTQLQSRSQPRFCGRKEISLAGHA